MYLFHYMLESNSSKVHINVTNLDTLNLNLGVSRSKDMCPHVGKWKYLDGTNASIQTCAIFVLLIQNFSNIYDMSHVYIPKYQYGLNYRSFMAFTPPKILGTLWSCKLRTPYMMQSWVTSEPAIPNTHITFFFKIPMIPCRFLAGITIKIN